MNILLVVPRFVENGKYYNFPYGLGYVSACLKEANFNVHCLNLCHHDEDIKTILSTYINKFNIDIIFTGGMSIHWNIIEELLNIIKIIDHNIITVAGGAIVTADPEHAINNLQIDYGIIGEGEITSVELVTALIEKENFETNQTNNIKQIYTMHSVDGIIYKENNCLVITTKRSPIDNLNLIPYPDYEGLEFDKWIEIDEILRGGLTGLFFDIDNKMRPAEINTSRSCPYNCTFCFHPLGNKYRQRSLDNVFKEIDYLIEKYDINMLLILDELFSNDTNRILDFTKRIKKYNIFWNAQWRVDNINEEILKELKKSNFTTLGLGLESVSDIVLTSMNKHTTKEKINKSYELCVKNKITPGGNIILGDVAETKETMMESINWWKEHPEYNVNVRHIIALPNSKIWQHCLSTGLIKDKTQFIKDGFPVINMSKIDDETFFKIKKQIDIEDIVNKHLIKGKVLSSQKINIRKTEKSIYEFVVKCPICKETSIYKYTKFTHLPYAIVLCKCCYKRIKISSRKAFKTSFTTHIKSILLLRIYVFYWLNLRQYNSIRNLVKFVREKINMDFV